MTRAADDAWSAPPEEDDRDFSDGEPYVCTVCLSTTSDHEPGCSEEDPHADDDEQPQGDRENDRAAMRRARARAMEVRSE